jgi:hypothetical protein
MVTCGGCECSDPQIIIDGQDPKPLGNGCGGCGAGPFQTFSVETQQWGDQPLPESTEGGFGGSNGIAGYSIDFIEIGEADNLGGLCEKDSYDVCSQDHGCKFWIEFTLDGAYWDGGGVWGGPEFTLGVGSGWAGGSVNVVSRGTTIYDGETGLYTTPATWKIQADIQANCGQTVEATTDARSFTLKAPEFSTFTNIPEGDSRLSYRVSCLPCAKAKKGSSSGTSWEGDSCVTVKASGAEGGDSVYTIDGLSYVVTPTNGSSVASHTSSGTACVQSVAASFSVTYRLAGTMTLPTGDPGPDLVMATLANVTMAIKTVSPTATLVSASDTQSTYSLIWDWSGVITPTAGSLLSSTLAIANITVAEGGPSWTKVDDSDSKPSTVEFPVSAATPVQDDALTTTTLKTSTSRQPLPRIDTKQY